MRSPILSGLLVLLGLLAGVSAAETPVADAARGAVDRFGEALTSGNTDLLRDLLPESGKVQLRLVVLGPEQGFFSSSQVQALLGDFLELGAVRSFRPVRVEQDPRGVAMARTRVELTDRQGRAVSGELHLSFRSEQGRWVLREIRETRL